MDNFASRLKELVKYRKISQKQLAEKLSISISTLNGYMTGYRKPDIATIKKLSEILNCSTDYFFSIETQHNENLAKLFYSGNFFDNEFVFILNSLEISETVLNGYIAGQINLKNDNRLLNKLCEVFHTTPECLLGIEEQNKNASNAGFPDYDTFVKDMKNLGIYDKLNSMSDADRKTVLATLEALCNNLNKKGL